jgi:hypothetical protein
MLRAPMARRLLLVFALLAPVLGLTACQRRIGAGCRVSTDCSIRGDRVCDLSHLVDGDGNLDPNGKGECIIDGCTPSSCPREGTCVQVYGAEFLSVACDPELEDRPQPYGDDLRERFAACRAFPAGEWEEGQPVACNDCGNHELCLPEGLCADILSVRTSCRKECRSDSNCRDGYECRRTGSNGVYSVATPDDPFGAEDVKICMPIAPVPGE